MMDASDPKLKGINPENFCYYPFTQLLLQPTGVASPCCWNQSIELGKVPEQNVSEIWNGEVIRRIRREFLAGHPVSCAEQMRHIQCHKWSIRDDTPTVQPREVMEGGLRRLDVRLNGKCNLQCVMCDVWKQPNGVYDASDFWVKGPQEIFPYLTEIDVLGGEPFVQGDTFRLIDAVAEVNANCVWAFVTNGSYRFGPAIQRRLDKIKIRWLQVSLDSIVPETYSRIRIGGDLAKSLATLDSYIAYRDALPPERQFQILITMCVQKLNWQEIGEFLDFGRAKNLLTILQFAFEPQGVSLLSLPEAERRAILEYLERLIPSFGRDTLHPISSPLQASLANQARQTAAEASL